MATRHMNMILETAKTVRVLAIKIIEGEHRIGKQSPGNS